MAKKIKKYDGFFIASFDKSNKLVDIFQLKSLNKEGGEEPFSADYYQGADGSQVILVHRPNKMKSSKGLIDIKEYVLLNIDLNGKVINKDSEDVTKQFMIGAKKALDICKKNNVDFVILKSNSPSCGCGQIYDGTFSKTLIEGDGIFTKLLKENNINCIDDKSFIGGK